MNMRELGRSGLPVSSIGLGCMGISFSYATQLPREEGVALIRAAVARGVPVLAICRGFQELNVAMGGSLHQRLQDLPDRIDHAWPRSASRLCSSADSA